MYYATDYISPLGRVKLTTDGEALIGLWLEGQKYFGGKVKEEFVENEEASRFWKMRRTGWTGILRGRSRRYPNCRLRRWEAHSSKAYGNFSARFPMGRLPLMGRSRKKWQRGWEKAACPARRSEGRSAIIRSLSLSPATGL